MYRTKANFVIDDGELDETYQYEKLLKLEEVLGIAKECLNGDEVDQAEKPFIVNFSFIELFLRKL